MKHLRSVISAYVTLKKFTPGLQKFYTDISAISATFSNSAGTKSWRERFKLRSFGLQIFFDRKWKCQGHARLQKSVSEDQSSQWKDLSENLGCF